DGMSFLGDQDFNGAANIQITTDDLTITSLNEDSGLLGFYTFDVTGNLGNDSSPGGANNGVVTGAVANDDATRGDVLSFDGTGDDVEINGLMGSPTNATLAAWVNVDTGATQGEVISIGNYVGLRVDEAGKGVQAFFWEGGNWKETQSNEFIASTGWHHVAYTLDDTANIQTLYIDGIAVGTTSYTESIAYSGLGTNTFIGGHANGSINYFFDGKIDDARIYDRALTVTEVGNLFNEATSTATDNIAITVTAVNDEPTLSGVTANDQTFTEGGTISTSNIFTGVTIDTIEAGQTILQADITMGGVQAGDTLTIDGQTVSNITADITTTALGGGST
ncbi:MAG: LamG domain-containing protein, partial [bacterium]|nr:LamG domain-containing protein [bacterium]